MAEYIDKSEIYRRYFNDTCGVVRMHVSDIDVIPSADVTPVVHGRWIDTEYYGPHHMMIVQCSHCRTESEGSLNDAFCPHCGAKMDMKD